VAAVVTGSDGVDLLADAAGREGLAAR
jgi:hypothetical protein